tara:strand:- start:205 stop:471 length:267 start_codon:yes stop_codon:yes gene_type:complete
MTIYYGGYIAGKEVPLPIKENIQKRLEGIYDGLKAEYIVKDDVNNRDDVIICKKHYYHFLNELCHECWKSGWQEGWMDTDQPDDRETS